MALSVALVAVCVLLAAVAVRLHAQAALAEGGRGVRADRIERLALADGVGAMSASDAGLPAFIDGAARHLVLFVSPACPACSDLVSGLGGEIPDGLTVVLTAAKPRRADRWVRAHSLTDGQVVLDDGTAIAERLGVAASPTVVGFAGGRAALAARVGGLDAVLALLGSRR